MRRVTPRGSIRAPGLNHAHLVQGAHHLARLLVYGVGAPVRVQGLELRSQAVVLAQPQRVQGSERRDLAGTAVPGQEARRAGGAGGARRWGAGGGRAGRREGQESATVIVVARVDPESPCRVRPVAQVPLRGRGAAVDRGRVQEGGECVHLLPRRCSGQVARECIAQSQATGGGRAGEGQAPGPGWDVGGKLRKKRGTLSAGSAAQTAQPGTGALAQIPLRLRACPATPKPISLLCSLADLQLGTTCVIDDNHG